MGHEIKAIDFMYYVATPEFINRWNEAKKGELICRMEKAIGGLPQYDSFEAMIAKMDEAGVEKVFITQCKMWSYRNKWMYMDTKLEEVAQYTRRYPDRFVGLAGSTPFASRSRCRKSTGRSKNTASKGCTSTSMASISRYTIPKCTRSMPNATSSRSRFRCRLVMCWKRCPENMRGRYTSTASPAIFPISKSSALTQGGLGWRS